MSGPMYNEYGEFNVHDDNMSDFSQNKNKVNNAINRNYLKLPISVVGPGPEFKKRTKKIGVYMSGGTGNTIVNAVTGEKYPGHLVGRFHEDLYFSVMLCSGENGPNPVTLFFESPTQYMKHFHRTVSFKNREDWLNKRDAYVKRG